MRTPASFSLSRLKSIRKFSVAQVKRSNVVRQEERTEKASYLRECREQDSTHKWIAHRVKGKTEMPGPEHEKYLAQIARARSFKAAAGIVNAMKADGVQPHNMFYTYLLKLLAKTGDVKKTRNILDEIEENGLEPNIITFGSAISVCHKARDISSAIEFWQRMLSRGVEPNVVAYNSLLATCAELLYEEKAAGFPKERVNLMETLLKQMADRKIQPTLVTYNTLLNICAKAGLWERALSIEREIHDRGLTPSTVTYDTLMNVCISAKEYNRALEFFDQARNNDAANIIVYSTAMCVYAELRRFHDVRVLWKEIHDKKIEVKAVALNVYLMTLASEGLIDEVRETLEVYSSTLNNFSSKTIVNQFYLNGYVEYALRIFKEMYESGRFSIWRENKLDLHLCQTGCARTALFYFLGRMLETGEFYDLKVIVGRNNHSTSLTRSPLGDSIRSLLAELNLAFQEEAKGGLLAISKETLECATDLPTLLEEQLRRVRGS